MPQAQPVVIVGGSGPAGAVPVDLTEVNGSALSETNRIWIKGSSIWTAADATLTRPNNATPYAVHNSIGSSSSCLFTFTSFFEANGAQELLTGLKLIVSKASITIPTGITVRGHVYNADVTATVLSSNADQATFKTMAAAEASKMGYVDFAVFTQGGTGSDCYESYGSPSISPLHLKAASAARNLYVILEATAAFTPTAQSVWNLYASRASL